MTTAIINTNSTTTFTFSSSVDTLIILPNGSITTSGGIDAIVTSLGGADLIVDGSVEGFNGFHDSSSVGLDVITVAQTGSLIGTDHAGVSVAGNRNYILNMGLIAGVNDVGISAGGNNKINNQGTIQGADDAISLVGSDTINNSGTITGDGYYSIYEENGGDRINNSGVIDGSTSQSTILLRGGGDTIVNSGAIASNGGGMAIWVSQGGSSSVANTGTITSARYGVMFAAGDDYVSNSGTISSFNDAIQVNGTTGKTTIKNLGLIETIVASDDVIYESAGGDSLFNGGTISSDGGVYGVDIKAGGDTIVNSGFIEGASTGVALSGGADYITNTGTISAFTYGIGVLGSDGGVNIKNSGLVEATNPGGYAIILANSGLGSSVTNSGTLRGTVLLAGASSTLNNAGEIGGTVVFGSAASSVVNTGDISGGVYFAGNDNSYDGATGTVEGVVHCSGSTGVYIGGARGTTFSVSLSDLAVTDQIIGGASAQDTLDIAGTGAISAHSLKCVTGIETVSLGVTQSIAIRESMVDTAAGHALTVRTAGADSVNLASVTSATDAVTVWGAAGDILTAGASLDTFAFASANASTGSGYDLIAGFAFARDKFDVTTNIDAVTGINTAVTTGSLSIATFNTDLASDLGSTKLGADHAVLFRASSGTLAGDSFLVVDLNGKAGYQAGADLVIRLTGATGTLTMGNFV